MAGCSQQKQYVTRIEGKQIGITAAQPETNSIESFIKPYREHIDEDLSAVLAYSPETLEKSKGEWQTNIGNFMADVTLKKARPVFEQREKKQVDICLLNHGGIRAMIPKGNVTARTAYEVMPFENSLIIIALKGEQLQEIAAYIIKEKKPHPLSGLTFTIAKDGSARKILVNGKPLVTDNIYYVATSDYLSNGGDNMAFFKKAVASYDMDYKLRNILIDYFKETDTLEVNHDKRISIEQ
ncbi:5'-nucleotidase [Flavobacterium pallidum]|uniref:5'-nucleotidase n=1 Tax=Flavobacterium pallidum TaxID=2172098 RepID=UPI002937311C|nr:5'-nucleotidase [Flavobacterium pallidum]